MATHEFFQASAAGAPAITPQGTSRSKTSGPETTEGPVAPALGMTPAWRHELTHAPISSPGLCSHCRHARTVSTPRETFWLCELSKSDPRFPKYPRLPVVECLGYEPGGSEPAGAPPVCS